MRRASRSRSKRVDGGVVTGLAGTAGRLALAGAAALALAFCAAGGLASRAAAVTSGGGITQIGPLFLAAVRQSVYQRSLALSTRHLEIQYTPLGTESGVIGAGVLAMHETLKARGVAPA